MIQEIVKMQTVSNATAQGGNVDTVNPVRFQYDQPAFMRHYRFYPVLKRPQSDIGQAIVTNGIPANHVSPKNRFFSIFQLCFFMKSQCHIAVPTGQTVPTRRTINKIAIPPTIQ